MIRERGVTVAVDADHLGGDPLPHLWLVPGIGEDHETAVGVQVDEAGSHHHAACVDAATGLWPPASIAKVEATVEAGHRPGAPRRAAAVEQRATADQQVHGLRPAHAGAFIGGMRRSLIGR